VKYRRFGKLDWEVSALGFGCMRLPTRGEYSEVDEARAVEMIRYAIDHGVNYFDTAWGYHGGNSEIVLGRALQNGYRDRVRVATKLPSPLVETWDDFDRFLNRQLEKLQVEHIDFYLLHGLRKARWENLSRLNVQKWAEGAMADGRIGCLGFSFHDSTEVLKEIIDAYDGWTFCQIQYNYMNEEEQAGTEGLEYAASKGLAVVIMEPLLGGRLVNPPDAVQAVWDSAPRKRTPADWALQWLWNKPEVSVVLSGMSTLEQVQQNIASAAASGVNTLTAEELAVVARARDKYRELCPIPCTGCEYCMPCPNGVEIPRNFEVYNSGYMYNRPEEAREWYGRMAEEGRASACVQCRECEEKCPQDILISEWMPYVDEVLARGAPYLRELPS